MRTATLSVEWHTDRSHTSKGKLKTSNKVNEPFSQHINIYHQALSINAFLAPPEVPDSWHRGNCLVIVTQCGAVATYRNSQLGSSRVFKLHEGEDSGRVRLLLGRAQRRKGRIQAGGQAAERHAHAGRQSGRQERKRARRQEAGRHTGGQREGANEGRERAVM